MFGWLALKSLTTWSSTFFWSGASPPPRQQYQRISTGPPGGTVAGPLLAGALALVAGEVLAATALALAGADAVEPPHAVASSAINATRTPGRDRRASMSSSSGCSGQSTPAPAVVRGRRGIGDGSARDAAGVVSGVARGPAPGSVCQDARTTTRST